MSHFSAHSLYAALARRTNDAWREAGLKFHPSTFSTQLQHAENSNAFRQAALRIIGDPQRVYNNFESANTLEHTMESLQEFAAFPQPYASSGFGYREALALTRAFLEVNNKAASRELLNDIVAADSPSGVPSLPPTGSEQRIVTAITMCLSLIRGFGAARPDLDLRDVDSLVTLVLDSDTLANDEWQVPSTHTIIDHWHRIDQTLPFCDFLFLVSRITSLPNYQSLSKPGAIDRLRAELPQSKMENLALLLDSTCMLGLTPAVRQTLPHDPVLDTAQPSLNATRMAQQLMKDAQSEVARAATPMQFLIAALARLSDAHVGPTELGARQAAEYQAKLYQPVIDTLCSQAIADSKIAVPVTQMDRALVAAVTQAAAGLFEFSVEKAAALLESTGLLGTSGQAMNGAPSSASATRMAEQLVAQLRGMIGMADQRSEAWRQQAVYKFYSAALSRLSEQHNVATAAWKQSTTELAELERDLRDATEAHKNSSQSKQEGEAKGMSPELLSVLVSQEGIDARSKKAAETALAAVKTETLRLEQELTKKFSSAIDELCTTYIPDNKLSSPAVLEPTLQTKLTTACGLGLLDLNVNRLSALLTSTQLLELSSEDSLRLSAALKNHMLASKVASEAPTAQFLLACFARIADRHADVSKQAKEWAAANQKKLYQAAIDELCATPLSDAKVTAAAQLGDKSLQAKIIRLIPGIMPELKRQSARLQIALRTEKLLYYCTQPHSDSFVAYYLAAPLDLAREPGVKGVRLLDWCALELKTARHFPAFVAKGFRPSAHSLFLNAYRAIIEADRSALEAVSACVQELPSPPEWSALSCPRWSALSPDPEPLLVHAARCALDALSARVAAVEVVQRHGDEHLLSREAVDEAEQAERIAVEAEDAAKKAQEVADREDSLDPVSALAARRVAAVVASVGTLMHAAVAVRNKDAIEFLLRQKVSPNIVVPEGILLPEGRRAELRATSALSLSLDPCPTPAFPHSVLANARPSMMRPSYDTALQLIAGGANIAATHFVYGGASANEQPARRVEVTVLQLLALSQYHCAAALRAHYDELMDGYVVGEYEHSLASLFSTSASAVGEKLATSIAAPTNVQGNYLSKLLPSKQRELAAAARADAAADTSDGDEVDNKTMFNNRRALPRARDPIEGYAPTPDERKYDTEKLIQLARRVRDAGVHPQSVTADLPEHVLTLSLPVSMPLVTELTQEAWGFDLNMPVNAFVFADVTAQDWAEKGAGSLLTVSRRPLSLLSVAAGAGTQFSDSACSILLAAENGAVKVDVTDEKQPTHALEVAISTRNVKVVRRLIRAGIKWAKTTQPLVNLCVQHRQSEALQLCLAAEYPAPATDAGWMERFDAVLASPAAPLALAAAAGPLSSTALCMDTVLRHGGGAWLAKQSAARLVDLMDRALDREDGLALAPLLVFAKNLHFMGAAGLNRAHRCYYATAGAIVHCAFKYNVPYDNVFEAFVAQIEAARDDCAVEFCNYSIAEDAWAQGKMDRAAFRYLTKLSFQHAMPRTFEALASRGGIDVNERAEWLGGQTLCTHAIIHGQLPLLQALCRVRPRPNFSVTNEHGHSAIALALAARLPTQEGGSVTVIRPELININRTPIDVRAVEQLLLPMLREGADPNSRDAGNAAPIVHLIARPFLNVEGTSSTQLRLSLLTRFLDAVEYYRQQAQKENGQDARAVDFGVRDPSGKTLEELVRDSLPADTAAQIHQYLQQRGPWGAASGRFARTSGSACLLM